MGLSLITNTAGTGADNTFTGANTFVGTTNLNGQTNVTDSLFSIRDDVDPTKIVQFQASGLTSATTRTITVPDANITLVGLTASQSLTNKTLDNTNTVTLKDNLFTLQDDGDVTKQAQFNLAGFTTGNTYLFALPNLSATLAHLGSSAQTFAGAITMSSTLTVASTVSMGGGTLTLGNGVVATAIGLAVGAITTGLTKAVSIGTGGLSGSTTNITIGSSVSGAIGTIVNNFAPQDPVFTVATLPAATAGRRAFISDGSTTFILGLGLTVTGGGANFGPVYADGSNWKYG